MEQNVLRERMDLHTHSYYSDGDLAPAELVRRAREAGVTLLSVTDHDSMNGVQEALDAGRREGLPVVPGVEMDNRYDQELHILGLCADPDCAPLRAELARAREQRMERNARILDQLLAAGYDVRPFLPDVQGVTTRLHIALALIRAGHASDTADAFQRFLRRGTPGFVAMQRPGPAQVIALLREAGAIPVLAHPCHLRGNVHAIVQELVDLGIGGIEAYYTTSSPGQTELFCSLAAQHHLLVTCGSDFHGANRPAAQLGCAWTPAPTLERTRQALLMRL